MAFKGFRRETIEFLRELAEHNDREWFAANKARYEAMVVEPAFAFIVAMGEELAEISSRFEAIPKRQGGSLMRVYRDTRFSRDKTPYKTNIGIQFRHEAGRDVHAPGYYLHIDPDEIFVGVGLWRPDATALDAIRRHIVDHSGLWEAIVTAPDFVGAFERQGESLKRPPRGFGADAPHLEDLKRKDHIAVAPLTPAAIAAPSFPRRLAVTVTKASEYMAFLCGALGVPFWGPPEGVEPSVLRQEIAEVP